MKSYTHKNIIFLWGGRLNIYLGNSLFPLKKQLNNGVLSWRLNKNTWLSINQLKKIIKQQ